MVKQIDVRTDTVGAPPNPPDARIEAIKEIARAQRRLLRIILGLQTASLVGAIILMFRT